MDYEQILGALSNMAPRDPAAVNPATTDAMARSRDAITKVLERSLARQSDPFTGLNDVATAATAALATRGKTPFGMALEQADAARMKNQLGAATALGQQAQREATVQGKGGISPYQNAQLMLQTLRFQAGRGDKDAALAEAAIDNIRSNLEPSDAVGFVVDAHAALQEAQRQAGRPLSGQESVAIITRQAQGGGYKPKQVGIQMQPDGFGGFVRTDNRAGTATPVPYNAPPLTPRGPQSLPTMPSVGDRTRVPFTPPPDGYKAPDRTVAGAPAPQLINPTPVGPAAPASPAAPGVQIDGRLTPSQQGQQAVKSLERQKSASAFSAVADYTLRDAETAGSGAMGPLGWMARMGGAAVEQIGAAGFGPDYQRLQAEYAPFLGRIVQQGAQSAGIKAGILSIAYLYSKAMDEQGVVGKHDLESALGLLGEAQGSVEQLRAALDVLKRNVAAKNGTALPAQSQPAQSALPQAGKVEVGSDGFAYRFKGGDPANPASWELIR